MRRRDLLKDNGIKYQFVDMGLPSGILWATSNVGTDSPTGKGLYFSWGNIDGHDETDVSVFTTNYYNTTSGVTLTTDIPSTVEYDAAMANITNSGGGGKNANSSKFQ